MNDLSCSERLLVWCVRRLSGAGEGTGHMPGLALPCFRSDFAAVADAFRMALGRLRAYQNGPMDVAICSATHLTGTENRFLIAAAAAQEGREAEVRRTLRPVFTHHHVLSPFAAAITQLGACMAGAGYWLPRRGHNGGGSSPPAHSLRWTRPQIAEGAGVHGVASAMPAATPQPVGAGCLAAMRWHSADMGTAHVMWPSNATVAQTGGL